MHKDAFNRLLEVNRQFYQSFAHPFAQTRRRLQPGVQRIVKQLSPEICILDLGCGSGELWRNLAETGFRGSYLGLDFSQELLRVAMENEYISSPASGKQTLSGAQATFLQADLATPRWDQPLEEAGFDVILAFAVLHHLPGVPLRLQVLGKARRLLAPTGKFILSVWQFMSSPRLRARIQPWESIGLSQDQVDPNDCLLDWRHGGSGLRYVHHFDQEELTTLARDSMFRVKETFHSDGEGGKLGLYQIWEPESR